MSVELIDSIEKFEELKNGWENVYKDDPHAQVFLSWLWLYGWFKSMSYQWFILSVKNLESSEYIAFLPLINCGQKIFGIQPIRHLTMGGKPFAVYTGFLCLPDHESIAMPALASYIQNNVKWDTFQMHWVRDPRLEIFLSYFPESKFSTKVNKGLVSLFIKLPDNYDNYLLDYLGKSFRKTLKSRLRFIDNSHDYSITIADEKTVKRDIDIMISQWKKRWGGKKEAVWYQKMLHHYFQNDLLWLYIIWHDSTPVAALSCLVDPAKKTVNGYITSYEPEYSKISPGVVSFGHAIKASIEKGYTTFDFAVGMDRYKLMFGPKKQKTKNVVIQRKGLRSTFPIATIKMIKGAGNSAKRVLTVLKNKRIREDKVY